MQHATHCISTGIRSHTCMPSRIHIYAFIYFVCIAGWHMNQDACMCGSLRMGVGSNSPVSRISSGGLSFFFLRWGSYFVRPQAGLELRDLPASTSVPLVLELRLKIYITTLSPLCSAIQVTIEVLYLCNWFLNISFYSSWNICVFLTYSFCYVEMVPTFGLFGLCDVKANLRLRAYEAPPSHSQTWSSSSLLLIGCVVVECFY